MANDPYLGCKVHPNFLPIVQVIYFYDTTLSYANPQSPVCVYTYRTLYVCFLTKIPHQISFKKSPVTLYTYQTTPSSFPPPYVCNESWSDFNEMPVLGLALTSVLTVKTFV